MKRNEMTISKTGVRYSTTDCSECAGLRAELAAARAVLQMIDAHYSASLDWQPSYVRHARAALAAISGEEKA